MKKIFFFLILLSFSLSACSMQFPEFEIPGFENSETEDETKEPVTKPSTDKTEEDKQTGEKEDIITKEEDSETKEETGNPSLDEETEDSDIDDEVTEDYPTVDDEVTEDYPTVDDEVTEDYPTIEDIVTNPENPDDSLDEPTIDDSVTEEELPTEEEVKEFLLASPVFETRKIEDISEITMDDFFNLGNRIDIKVTISDEELRKLQSDYETGYKSEIYRLASKVVITLTNYGNAYTWEFENVGIRQKGNTSRQSIMNGDGYLNVNHYKLSFDETFDDPERYDSSFIEKYGDPTLSKRDFLDMSGLDFKWNKNYDMTHIREIYANYLYRAAGIMVQHAGLSTFTLVQSDRNNRQTSMGLCTVFEPATKSFIKRSLQSDVSYVNMSDWTTEKAGSFGLEAAKYGDLYKCIYGADLTNNSISGNKIGVGNTSGSYIPLYDRKTNKDDIYDDYLLKDAVNAISTGNYDRISQYVDLEYLAICEAVGFVVGNPDSMRYNTNNFMVYMRRTDGKMVFIPIDSDRCFGIVKDWNVKEGYMNVGMLDRKNSTNDNTISLLLNTVLSKSDNEAKSLYIEFCNKIKESDWVKTETFDKYFEMASKSYSDEYFSLTNDNDNYTFKNYITNKVKQIISDSSNDNNDNNNNDNTGSTNDYENIYIVSSINNWGDYSSSELEKYKFTKISDYTYSITITVNEVLQEGYDSYIKFKFNSGYADYSKIDWTLSSDLKTLIMNPQSSARLYGVEVGDQVEITINTKTLEANVVIK